MHQLTESLASLVTCSVSRLGGCTISASEATEIALQVLKTGFGGEWLGPSVLVPIAHGLAMQWGGTDDLRAFSALACRYGVAALPALNHLMQNGLEPDCRKALARAGRAAGDRQSVIERRLEDRNGYVLWMACRAAADILAADVAQSAPEARCGATRKRLSRSQREAIACAADLIRSVATRQPGNALVATAIAQIAHSMRHGSLTSGAAALAA